MSRPRKVLGLQVVACGVVMLVTLGLSLRDYDAFQLGTYVDDADYAVLARAIASEHTYGLIHGPGQAQPTRFPAGFPLLLAPVAWFFPNEPEVMRLVSLWATLGNVVLLVIGWPYLTDGRSRWWGVAVAALYGWSPLVIGHTRMVMTEPVFTTCTLASLILTERCMRANGVGPPATVLLGALVGFATLVRTIGIVLWCAVIVRLFVAGPLASAARRVALMCGGAVLVVVCVIWLTPVRISDLFPRQYADLLVDPSSVLLRYDNPDKPRVWQTVHEYVTLHLRATVLPFGGGTREEELGRTLHIPHLSRLVALTVVGLILIGASGRDGRVSLTVAVFEAMFAAVLVFWPGREARLLYPIQPFLLWHFIGGFTVIARRLIAFSTLSTPAAQILRIASALAVTGLLCGASLYKGTTDREGSLRHVRDLRVGTTWLKTSSPSDALIMTEEPRIVYLYSGRKTVDPPRVRDSADFRRAVQEHGVDYVMIAPRLRWREDGALSYSQGTLSLLRIVKVLAADRELTLLFESPKDFVQVYKVNAGGN